MHLAREPRIEGSLRVPHLCRPKGSQNGVVALRSRCGKLGQSFQGLRSAVWQSDVAARGNAFPERLESRMQ